MQECLRLQSCPEWGGGAPCKWIVGCLHVFNIFTPSSNGGSVQETVTIDNQKNTATINIHAGSCSSTTIFDYKHGYIASRVLSRRACYVLKMDHKAIPALDKLQRYLYEKQTMNTMDSGEYTWVKYNPLKSLFTKVDWFLFGSPIEQLCKNMPLYEGEVVTKPTGLSQERDISLLSTSGKHQMVDDAGAAGGPGGPGGPGLGGRRGFPGGFSSGLRGRVRGHGRGRGLGRRARGGIRDFDFFLGASLKDEVLKIMPVQKQTWAGQRIRFKAFVAIGDYNGHVGLGVKCSKEVATAIRGAIILAKLSIVPVRRGYWGNKIGKPHTVPCKVTGRCGSVLVRLIPAPRGTGIVSAPVPKKLLMMAGIDDCYTSARGCTATLGNFAKATFDATSKTYSYLTPDLWKETVFTKSPYQEFIDHLVKAHTRVSVQRTQAAAVATT
ncbi:hypothetical protein NN561_010582 [Cricetulus griseus]